MATHLSGRRVRVWLFYLKHLQGEGGTLGIVVIREICSYFGDKVLVHVNYDFLRIFNTYTWGPRVPLSTNIRADFCSVWLVLEDGRVFCSGGDSKRHLEWVAGMKLAYLLSRNGKVDQLPDMLVPRRDHGIIQINFTLLIFGGCKF